jgi:hypothetical protein
MNASAASPLTTAACTVFQPGIMNAHAASPLAAASTAFLPAGIVDALLHHLSLLPAQHSSMGL